MLKIYWLQSAFREISNWLGNLRAYARGIFSQVFLNLAMFRIWGNYQGNHMRLSHFLQNCILCVLLHKKWTLLQALPWNCQKTRNSPPKVFLRKVILKICSKFTGKHPCWSVISIKLQNNFTEITLWHVCSPINLVHIFRTLFLKNTSEGLLLKDL